MSENGEPSGMVTGYGATRVEFLCDRGSISVREILGSGLWVGPGETVHLKITRRGLERLVKNERTGRMVLARLHPELDEHALLSAAELVARHGGKVPPVA